MSDLSTSSRSESAAFNRRSRSAFDGAIQAFIRLILGVLVIALATRLFHGRVDLFEAMLLGGVLAAAAAFGLTMGLLAAAIALITYHSVLGARLQAPDFSSPGTMLLALFGATVAVVGLCADAAMQRHKQARSMLDAGRPLSPYASAGGAERFFRLAKRRAAALGRVPAKIEALQALASFAVALAGVAGAVTLHKVIGPTGTALVALAGVLIVAEQTSARFGLVAGALTAILLAWALPSSARGQVAGVQEAVEVLLFSVVGWRMGALADELRHERAARNTLTGAGRDLSASADETAVRRILLDSLQRIDSMAVFEVRDDIGGLLTSGAGVPNGQAMADKIGWRSRRLEADGRDVGEVRWRFSGAATSARTSDEIAASLIDLGASAIVRARLTAEKADMEYITRAEHLRTILLDAISHHFRTPLAGILGSVTSILNLPEPHDRNIHRDFLLIIKEQANRLNRYVDNFLSLARLEADAIEVNTAEVNLEMLIYDVWDSFGAIGGARRYLQVDLDVDAVRSDAALLAQVFGNILENAIKYSSEESLVEVRAQRDGDRLMIEVLDQGCGVPEDSIPRMFDRFYRSHAAKAPGLGLGLYITRSLVEILGGVLSARNRSDGQSGLVVSIGLPLAESVS